jgi:hypothetical protein
MYKVIRHFTDLQDNHYAYKVGDEYPRKGMSVLPSRIKELAGNENRQGCPLIEEIEEPKPVKKSKSVEKADEE